MHVKKRGQQCLYSEFEKAHAIEKPILKFIYENENQPANSGRSEFLIRNYIFPRNYFV